MAKRSVSLRPHVQDAPTDAERKALRKLGKRILGYKPEVVAFSGMLIS